MPVEPGAMVPLRFLKLLSFETRVFVMLISLELNILESYGFSFFNFLSGLGLKALLLFDITGSLKSSRLKEL